MSLEVELKAPCRDCERKVLGLGARFVKSEEQEDVYYAHPGRDFRKTDEALRIRSVKRTDKAGSGLVITYKGPKMKSDLKERREIEFDVGGQAYELLEALGFRKAFTIRKRRSTYELDGLTVCCDLVEGLGEYVEVESKDMADREKIIKTLGKIGVADETTTDSYSQLLGI